MLPGVRDLGAEFGVNFMTANKAVNVLNERGLVNRITGKGTFVSSSAPVRMHTLAVMVKDVNLPLTSRALRGVGVQAAKSDTRLLFFQHFGDGGRETAIARELTAERRVDGVILLPSQSNTPTLPALDILAKAAVPVVVFPHHATPQWQRFNSIRGDHCAGFERGTTHLLALGHRQIVLVFPSGIDGLPLSEGDLLCNERWQGYARAMQAAGAEPQPPIQFDPDHNGDSGTRAETLEQIRANTAVFAFSDSTAAALLTGLHQAGVRVPDDVALLSYDGVPFTAELHLSTMSQPMEAMGRRAVEILVGNKPGVEPVDLVFEAELIERGSTRRCRAHQNGAVDERT